MRTLLALVALLLLLPTAAQAATVSVADGVLTYSAAPGETNIASIEFDDGATNYVVQDERAPLTAGAGCAANPDGAVLCPATGPPAV